MWLLDAPSTTSGRFVLFLQPASTSPVVIRVAKRQAPDAISGQHGVERQGYGGIREGISKLTKRLG